MDQIIEQQSDAAFQGHELTPEEVGSLHPELTELFADDNAMTKSPPPANEADTPPEAQAAK